MFDFFKKRATNEVLVKLEQQRRLSKLKRQTVAIRGNPHIQVWTAENKERNEVKRIIQEVPAPHTLPDDEDPDRPLGKHIKEVSVPYTFLGLSVGYEKYTKERLEVTAGVDLSTPGRPDLPADALELITKDGDTKAILLHTTGKRLKQFERMGVIDDPKALTSKVIKALGKWLLRRAKRALEAGTVGVHDTAKRKLIQIAQDRMEYLKPIESFINKSIPTEAAAFAGFRQEIHNTFEDYINNLNFYKNVILPQIFAEMDSNVLNHANQNLLNYLKLRIQGDIVRAEALQLKFSKEHYQDYNLADTPEHLRTHGYRKLGNFIRTQAIHDLLQTQCLNQILVQGSRGFGKGDANTDIEKAKIIVREFNYDKHNPLKNLHQMAIKDDELVTSIHSLNLNELLCAINVIYAPAQVTPLDGRSAEVPGSAPTEVSYYDAKITDSSGKASHETKALGTLDLKGEQIKEDEIEEIPDYSTSSNLEPSGATIETSIDSDELDISNPSSNSLSGTSANASFQPPKTKEKKQDLGELFVGRRPYKTRWSKFLDYSAFLEINPYEPRNWFICFVGWNSSIGCWNVLVVPFTILAKLIWNPIIGIFNVIETTFLGHRAFLFEQLLYDSPRDEVHRSDQISLYHALQSQVHQKNYFSTKVGLLLNKIFDVLLLDSLLFLIWDVPKKLVGGVINVFTIDFETSFWWKKWVNYRDLLLIPQNPAERNNYTLRTLLRDLEKELKGITDFQKIQREKLVAEGVLEEPTLIQRRRVTPSEFVEPEEFMGKTTPIIQRLLAIPDSPFDPFRPQGLWNVTANGFNGFIDLFVHNLYAPHPFFALCASAGAVASFLAVFMPQLLGGSNSVFVKFLVAQGELWAKEPIPASMAGSFTNFKMIAAFVELFEHGLSSWIAKAAAYMVKSPVEVVVGAGLSFAVGYGLLHYNLGIVSAYFQQHVGNSPELAELFAGMKVLAIGYELMFTHGSPEKRRVLAEKFIENCVKAYKADLIRAALTKQKTGEEAGIQLKNEVLVQIEMQVSQFKQTIGPQILSKFLEYDVNVKLQDLTEVEEIGDEQPLALNDQSKFLLTREAPEEIEEIEETKETENLEKKEEAPQFISSLDLKSDDLLRFDLLTTLAANADNLKDLSTGLKLRFSEHLEAMTVQISFRSMPSQVEMKDQKDQLETTNVSRKDAEAITKLFYPERHAIKSPLRSFLGRVFSYLIVIWRCLLTLIPLPFFPFGSLEPWRELRRMMLDDCTSTCEALASVFNKLFETIFNRAPRTLADIVLNSMVARAQSTLFGQNSSHNIAIWNYDQSVKWDDMQFGHEGTITQAREAIAVAGARVLSLLIPGQNGDLIDANTTPAPQVGLGHALEGVCQRLKIEDWQKMAKCAQKQGLFRLPPAAPLVLGNACAVETGVLEANPVGEFQTIMGVSGGAPASGLSNKMSMVGTAF